MEFVQLCVEPLSPVLLRGQKSLRKSQRLTARARMPTRVGNTKICLPKGISTSMQDLLDSAASSVKVQEGSVAIGRQTQEHLAGC